MNDQTKTVSPKVCNVDSKEVISQSHSRAKKAVVPPAGAVSFYKDLVTALGAIPALKKDAANPFYNSSYLSLPHLIETVRPILAKHNLAMTQSIWTVDGQLACQSHLIHVSGAQYETDVLLVPLTQKTAQGMGSASSYARRYQAMALLNIAAEDDDDGNLVSIVKTQTKAGKALASADEIDF